MAKKYSYQKCLLSTRLVQKTIKIPLTPVKIIIKNRKTADMMT